MALCVCKFCGATPAIRGETRYGGAASCIDCRVVYALGADIPYARRAIRAETNPERIRRALAWEREHGRPRVVLPLLEHALARLTRSQA